MLKIKPPEYIYCPFCGEPLQDKEDDHKIRKYCRKDNWTYYPHVLHSAAAIAVMENKVLMVKRSREPYMNTWMFPAGFVEFGEHPAETAERELKEETGLDLVGSQLYDVIQSTDDPRAPGHFIFFYKVTAKGVIDIKDKDENNDIGWFEIARPAEIGWMAHKLVMEKLQKEIA